MTTFTANGRSYDVTLDAPIVRRALLTAIVVDAISSAPPRTPIAAEVNFLGAKIRIGSGGMLAVSGRSSRIERTPFELSIRARGYEPHLATIDVAPDATFPISLGTITLQPLAVRLEGRATYERDRKPVAGASIVAQMSPSLTTTVQADADGYFAIDGIGGVRTITLIATKTAAIDLTTVVTIDYGNPVNFISLRLKKKPSTPPSQ